MITRRHFVQAASATSFALALRPSFASAAPATYQNPILGGDHPDASPIRVGSDFYLTRSSFE
jgi:xylan 1,4-beta-xylosidase